MTPQTWCVTFKLQISLPKHQLLYLLSVPHSLQAFKTLTPVQICEQCIAAMKWQNFTKAIISTKPCAAKFRNQNLEVICAFLSGPSNSAFGNGQQLLKMLPLMGYPPCRSLIYTYMNFSIVAGSGFLALSTVAILLNMTQARYTRGYSTIFYLEPAHEMDIACKRKALLDIPTLTSSIYIDVGQCWRETAPSSIWPLNGKNHWIVVECQWPTETMFL